MEAAIDFTSGVMGNYTTIVSNYQQIKEFIDLKGGIANVYVGQPLDTIKVKMQMFPHLYKNAFKCGLETFKKDGILSEYLIDKVAIIHVFAYSRQKIFALIL